MNIAIMQPYLFPYIGYFQLIDSVDKFVIFDDAQFIKRGWVNRNRILVNGRELMFTFSIKKDSSYLNINERYFADSFNKEKEKLLRTLKASYGKCEKYDEVVSLIKESLNVNVFEQDISMVITRSLKLFCSYMDIKTPIIISSELNKNVCVGGENRVIEMNKRLNSTHYINPIGGTGLYSEDSFNRQNIKLSFLKSKLTPYKQNVEGFIPSLSIIDVLMFNTKTEVKKLLNEYELVRNAIACE